MGRALPGIGLLVKDGELTANPRTVPTFFLGYLGEHVHRREDGAWQVAGPARRRPVANRRPGQRRTTDGWLHFEGRDDDVIISAGYRIGPFEVESALVAHPAVAEAAAVAAPDEERGVGRARGGRAARRRLRAVAAARARAAGARQARDRARTSTRASSTSPPSCRRRPAARSSAPSCEPAAERRAGPRASMPRGPVAIAQASWVTGSALAYSRSSSSSSTSCCTVPAGGRSTSERRDDAERHAARRDDVGEVVAAGQRRDRRVAARGSAPWCGRLRPCPARPARSRRTAAPTR